MGETMLCVSQRGLCSLMPFAYRLLMCRTRMLEVDVGNNEFAVCFLLLKRIVQAVQEHCSRNVLAVVQTWFAVRNHMECVNRCVREHLAKARCPASDDSWAYKIMLECVGFG